MTNKNDFDIIITGGSYAGLSAAMALGRSLRSVLIIDGGKPCNAQTPYSHNFITHDGETPKEIAEKAKEQVLAYPTVQYINDFVTAAQKTEPGFTVATRSSQDFTAKKLLFATGLKDIMPAIEGFAECWGISVLHCPYCHGYEVADQTLGVLANGEMALEMVRLIRHWSKKLTLYTNGKATLSSGQQEAVLSLNISIVELPIASFEHSNGQLRKIRFANGLSATVDALFARPVFEQHCTLPQSLGCELTEQGFLKVDDFHRTTIPGVYAAGDSMSMLRAVPVAVASGTKAGAFLNKDLIDEEYRKQESVVSEKILES